MAYGRRICRLAAHGGNTAVVVFYERRRAAGFDPHLCPVAKPRRRPIRTYLSLVLLFPSSDLVSRCQGAGLDGSIAPRAGPRRRWDEFPSQKPRTRERQFWAV